MEQGSNSLSVSEAQALLAQAPESLVKKTPRHWISGVDATQLLSAIDSKAKKVYLVTLGRTFVIKYESKDKVWIQVENGFVPCAWVTVSKLRKETGEANVLATL